MPGGLILVPVVLISNCPSIIVALITSLPSYSGDCSNTASSATEPLGKKTVPFIVRTRPSVTVAFLSATRAEAAIVGSGSGFVLTAGGVLPLVVPLKETLFPARSRLPTWD